MSLYYAKINSPFPLAQINGGQINIGLLAPFSVAKTENALFWLGADDRGFARVYKSNGIGAQKVSTPAIENYLQTFTVDGAGPLVGTYGYCYSEAGHVFYVMVIGASSGAATACVVFDQTTGFWHTRTYPTIGGLVTFPIGFASAPKFSGTTGVGDNYVILNDTNGIYPQAITYFNDNGSPTVCQRTAPHLADHNRWIKYSRFEIDGSFGTANPVLTYSNNGGQTFGPSSGGYPMQQRTPEGDPSDIPELQRFFALQLGRSRDRVYRVTVTATNQPIRISGAYASADPGTEK